MAAIGVKTIQLLADKLNSETGNLNWGHDNAESSDSAEYGIFLVLTNNSNTIIASSTMLPNNIFVGPANGSTEVSLSLNNILFTETYTIESGTPTGFQIVYGKKSTEAVNIAKVDGTQTTKFVIDRTATTKDVLFEGFISGGAELGANSQFALTNIKITFN